MTQRQSTWSPIDLLPVWDGEGLLPPDFLLREDGVGLLYAGKVHSLHGPPEAGKGWIAHRAASQLVSEARHVLYVDFEDEARSAVDRQRLLGIERDELSQCFHYLRPDEPLDEEGSKTLERLAEEFDFDLAILDGLTEAFVLHGFDPLSNADTARWLRLLPRRLADAGMAVLQIDHVTKAKAGQRTFAIGGQHKLAGIDVAFALESVRPFGRGQEGRSKLQVVKDRPGWLQQHTSGRTRDIALVEYESEVDLVGVVLRAPSGNPQSTEAPDDLKREIYEVVTAHPGRSQNFIRDSVRGKSKLKVDAIEELVEAGHIRIEVDGRSHRHYPDKPFGG